MILELREDGRWPPAVLSIVLVECLQGHPGRDAKTNRFLRTCDVIEEIPEILARRAAFLRTRARRGSAVDALVVALAETWRAGAHVRSYRSDRPRGPRRRRAYRKGLREAWGQ
jgi:hypothetical protein